jgi:hypothetical protein
MTRFLGALLIYGGMLTGWTVVGLSLLFAPARFGNFIHENLQLCPRVESADWGKKLFLRTVGVALLAFAVRFIFGLFDIVR